jgi:hypothetical protein
MLSAQPNRRCCAAARIGAQRGRATLRIDAKVAKKFLQNEDFSPAGAARSATQLRN